MGYSVNNMSFNCICANCGNFCDVCSKDDIHMDWQNTSYASVKYIRNGGELLICINSDVTETQLFYTLQASLILPQRQCILIPMKMTKCSNCELSCAQYLRYVSSSCIQLLNYQQSAVKSIRLAYSNPVLSCSDKAILSFTDPTYF